MQEKAREKIEQEEVKIPGAEELRLCLTVWLRYDAAAAELILDNKKSMEKCFEFMKNKARPKAVNGCYQPGREEAMSWILEFYGVSAERAQELIEGGLMYAVIQEEASRWAPFGQKAEPVKAEPPKPQAPAGDIFSDMLDDL